ncbi:hypothetical protein OIO90_005746 [Microbotryomycetes sp. JL221]|nr:hypothetical protein OIO90_005746 [Microbotryomycetes sp. JL221]
MTTLTAREAAGGVEQTFALADSDARQRSAVGPPFLKMISVLGKGCSGAVYLAEHRHTGTPLALKVIKKARVLEQGNVRHVVAEQKLLRLCTSLRLPFVTRLLFSMQDDTYLYLGLDFCAAGDLAGRLAQWGRLSPVLVRFYMSELVDALASLHRIGIVYRDLKPENVLISAQGHLVLTDFGLATMLKPASIKLDGKSQPDKIGPSTVYAASSACAAPAQSSEGEERSGLATTFCGTSEYLAPEILLGEPYSFAVDVWALGIMMFEMLAGVTPWPTESRTVLYENVLQAGVSCDSSLFSTITQDFVLGLLQKNPGLRFSLFDGRIQQHPYFSNIDWNIVARRGYGPPWSPDSSISLVNHVSAIDLKYFDADFTEQDIDSLTLSSHPRSSNEQIKEWQNDTGEGQTEFQFSLSADTFRDYDFNAVSITTGTRSKATSWRASLKNCASKLYRHIEGHDDVTNKRSDDVPLPASAFFSSSSSGCSASVGRTTTDIKSTSKLAMFVAVPDSRHESSVPSTEHCKWEKARADDTSVAEKRRSASSSLFDWSLLPSATTNQGHVLPSARNGDPVGRLRGRLGGKSLLGLRSAEVARQSLIQGARAWRAAPSVTFPAVDIGARLWSKIRIRRRRAA